MLARLEPERARAALVPARRPGRRTQTRAEAAARRPRCGRAAARARRRASSRGDDYRAFLARHGLDAGAGRGRRRGRARARPPRRLLALHAGPAPRARRRLAGAALRARHRSPATNTVVVGPRAALARRRVDVRGRLLRRAARVEAKLRYRSPAVAAPRHADGGRVPRSTSTSRPTASRAGRPPCCTRATRSSAAESSRPPKITRMGRGMLVVAFTWGDFWRLALAVFLLAVGLALGYSPVRLGGTFGRLSSLIKGTEREVLPVIGKVGGSRGPRQRTARQGRPDHGQRRRRGRQRRHRRPRGELGGHAPVQKVSGLAAGISYGAADFKARRDWRHAVQAGKEAAARREQDLAEELRDARGVTDGDHGSSIPAEEDFRPIAHLVGGGLALRLDLTYDEPRGPAGRARGAARTPRRLRRDRPSRSARTPGRCAPGSARSQAELVGESCEDGNAELGLRRVLETVADSFAVAERDDGVWVELPRALRRQAAREGDDAP